MKPKRFYFCIILFLLSPASLLSQDNEWEQKKIVSLINDADGYFIYDANYKAAAEIYEEILNKIPGDHNTSYKLGVCYLNITGKHHQALNLLEYACENYVEDHEYSTIGKSAPFDVLYYMGFACQVNMKLEKAIVYYKKYQNLLRVKDAAEIEYINLQIKACRNALRAADTSTGLEKVLFTPWLKDFKNVIKPVISGNDSVFIFTVDGEEENMIFCSFKKSGEWSPPENITDKLSRHDDMFSNSITTDGKILVVARNDGIQGNIYISRFKRGEWSKLDKMNKNVNTRYWESHAFITGDGSELIFASNRPGGYGSLDLYRVQLDDNSDAGEPVNLGPVINTELEENTPYFNSETGSLYFSSTGHQGFGGYDIFYSQFNKKWTEPIHLQFPVNTTSDDLNYIPLHTNTGLMSTTESDTSLFTNVYLINIEEKELPEVIVAEGKIKLGDGMDIEGNQLELLLLNTANDSLISEIHASEKGSFNTELLVGDYKLIIKYESYKTDTLNIHIPEDFKQEKLYLTETLTPDRVESGEFLVIRTILFDFDNSSLRKEAKIEIEKLINILVDHPDLRVCIEGYTDAIGSSEYNLNLSEERAERVKEYLVNAGIESKRLKISARGESAFVADNFRDDGSDNPAGRKYNRRVSINIENNGYTIPVESYFNVPGHIKKPYSYSFFVVISEEENALSPGYFSRYGRSEFSFINEVKTDSSYLYLMGGFRTKLDAITYLVSLKNDGFENSYVITEYDLPEKETVSSKLPPLYTVQIHALRKKYRDKFPGLRNVREISGGDGFYRYTVGEYKGYARAKAALERIKKIGYSEAFIKAVELLEKQIIPEK